MRLTILDRYMLTELAGPFLFGFAIFMAAFATTQLLALGRLVSSEHAPLWAALQVFLWSLPPYMSIVLPMALLLGTLLAIQRLSAESEIIAMKAGGIGFLRIAYPFLVAGLLMSVVTFVVQEVVAPFAADQVAQIENDVILHTSAFNRDLTVSAPLPGGGRQVTIATSYEPHSQALLNVTLVQYDRHNQPTQIVFADRADFTQQKWVLENASFYRFNPDGTLLAEPKVAQQQVELGENPTELVNRISLSDPQQMSRSQIASIVRSGQLTQMELRKYVTTYQEKLAQPFACFVFVLIAIPYGIRAARAGGGIGVGFATAVAVIFIYYVVLVVFSYVSEAFLTLAALWAWMPNIIFTTVGLLRLRRAAEI